MNSNKTEEEAFKKARNIVFQLLKTRHQTEKEIRDKLGKKAFEKNTIEKTVKYFKDLDFINDRLFAQKWIRYRLAKPYGKVKIRFELKNKGVSQPIIDDEIREATGAENYSESETAWRLAQKQIAKHENKNIDKEKIKQRVYRYLARRGFGPDAIQEAIKKYDRQ